MMADLKKMNSETMNTSIKFENNQLVQIPLNQLEDDNVADLWKGGIERKAFIDNLNSCIGFTGINLRKEDDFQDLESQQQQNEQFSRMITFEQNQKPQEIKENQVFNMKTIEYFKENDSLYDQIQFSQNAEFLNQSSKSMHNTVGNERTKLKNTLSNYEKTLEFNNTNFLEENNEIISNAQQYNKNRTSSYENLSQFLHRNQINPLKFNNRQNNNDIYENTLSSHTSKSMNIHNIIVQFQKNIKESKFETEIQDSSPVTYKSNFLKRLYFVLKFLKKIKFNVTKFTQSHNQCEMNYLLTYSFIHSKFSYIKQVLVRSIGHIQNGFSHLIDDYASHIDNKQDKSYIVLKVEYLLSKIQVFQQDSFGIIIWEFIQFITILIQSIWIPMKKIFMINYQEFDDGLFQFSSFIFALSILVRFNTSVYYQGNLATDRKEIAKRYLKASFILDFTTTIILIISSHINDSTVLPLIILRLYQLPSIEKKIKTALIMRQKNQLIQLTYIDLKITFYPHHHNQIQIFY